MSRRVVNLSILLACLVVGAGAPLSAKETPRRLVPAGKPGQCDRETWKINWPGCSYENGVEEGRLHLVDSGGALWWRIALSPGGVGPEEGGVGWRWPFPEKTRRGVELRYTLHFEEGFEFVKGGKLPGLCGGPKTITGGDKCTGHEGWSARLMWRREGRGQAYVYHPLMPSKFGDEFDFPTDFRFPVGTPVGVRLAVTMNSEGKRDGSLRIWISLPGEAERQVVSETAMLWTKNPAVGVDSLLFNTFHGGSDGSWAPQNPIALQIGEIGYTPTSP